MLKACYIFHLICLNFCLYFKIFVKSFLLVQIKNPKIIIIYLGALERIILKHYKQKWFSVQNIQIDAIWSIRFNLDWYFKIRFGSIWIINIMIWIWTENIKTEFYSVWFGFVLNPNQKPNFHPLVRTLLLEPVVELTIVSKITIKIFIHPNFIIFISVSTIWIGTYLVWRGQ